jgi:hypothetical protein
MIIIILVGQYMKLFCFMPTVRIAIMYHPTYALCGTPFMAYINIYTSVYDPWGWHVGAEACRSWYVINGVSQSVCVGCYTTYYICRKIQ